MIPYYAIKISVIIANCILIFFVLNQNYIFCLHNYDVLKSTTTPNFLTRSNNVCSKTKCNRRKSFDVRNRLFFALNFYSGICPQDCNYKVFCTMLSKNNNLMKNLRFPSSALFCSISTVEHFALKPSSKFCALNNLYKLTESSASNLKIFSQFLSKMYSYQNEELQSPLNSNSPSSSSSTSHNLSLFNSSFSSVTKDTRSEISSLFSQRDASSVSIQSPTAYSLPFEPESLPLNDVPMAENNSTATATKVSRPSYIVPIEEYVARQEMNIQPPAYRHDSAKAVSKKNDVLASEPQLSLLQNAIGNETGFKNKFLGKINDVYNEEGFTDAYTFVSEWENSKNDEQLINRFTEEDNNDIINVKETLTEQEKQRKILLIDLFVTELDETSAILPGEKCVMYFHGESDRERLINNFKELKSNIVAIGWAKTSEFSEQRKRDEVNVQLLKYGVLATPTNITADDEKSQRICMQIISRCKILSLLNPHPKKFRAKIIPYMDVDDEEQKDTLFNMPPYSANMRVMTEKYRMPYEKNKESIETEISKVLSLYDACNAADYKYKIATKKFDAAAEIKNRKEAVNKINDLLDKYHYASNNKINELISFAMLEYHADYMAKLASIELTSTLKRLRFASTILEMKLKHLKQSIASAKENS